MHLTAKPYLIIPKLIEQPTWGGDYILKIKRWENKPYLINKKIGQSYELFSRSKLLLNITDSKDDKFCPDVGTAESEVAVSTPDQKEGQDYVYLSDVLSDKRSAPTPLVKLNQSYGNSFQLHIRPGTKNISWQPKAESWYYLEPGKLTFGINKNKSIADYKKACTEIESKMQFLSSEVIAHKITPDQAKKTASDFIKTINPWQYVNVHEVEKYSLVDLSPGGIHHSWEEDRAKYPQGNVVYEVQQDVMDPVCTLRSFDQGKFKSDGTIRPINIDDYFKFIDTNPQVNDINNLTLHAHGGHLLKTKYYCLDIIECNRDTDVKTNGKFAHLFVREGAAVIKTGLGAVKLYQGHSCFIPNTATSYLVSPINGPATILKTFV